MQVSAAGHSGGFVSIMIWYEDALYPVMSIICFCRFMAVPHADTEEPFMQMG